VRVEKEAHSRELIVVAALLLVSVLYAFYAIDFSTPPFEDAAILMRYSQHLAHGHGIIWNLGEKPVDGATDFLFMIVVALLAKTGLTIESSARCISFASHIFLVLLVYHAIRSLHRSRQWVALLCALYVAIGPGLNYVQAYFGTPFFALFSCISWYYAFRITKAPRSPAYALGFTLSSFIMGLIRPEGVLLACMMLAAIVFACGIRASLKTIFYFLSVFIVLGGIYFLWRWTYFGYPLPNPFYKKGGGHIYPASFLLSARNAILLCLPFIIVYVYGIFAHIIPRIARTFSLKKVLLACQAAILAILFLAWWFLSRMPDYYRWIFDRPAHWPAVTGFFIFGGTAILIAYLFARMLKDFLQGGDHAREHSLDAYFFEVGRKTVFALIPIAGFTAIWILLSDETNYFMRFQYALLPIALISWPPIMEGFREKMALPRLQDFGIRARLAVSVFAMGLIACTLLYAYLLYAKKQCFSDGRRDVGIVLREYRDRQYTLATTEAGLLPLYSQWKTIDAGGLNDPWIVHHGGITCDYLTRHDPAVIMFSAYFSPLVPLCSGLPQEVVVLKIYAETHDYILAAAFGKTPYVTHYYYVKKDARDARAIVEKIREIDYAWYDTGERCLNYALLKNTG